MSRPLLTFAAGIFAIGGVIRFLQATPAASAVAPWLDEQLPPLLGLIVAGRPIEHLDQRQYGVVMFLVLDPAVRLFGEDPTALRRYVLLISVGTFLLAYAVLSRRLGPHLWPKLALAAVWFAWLPAIYAVANRTVETWLLLFFVIGLVLWVDERTRPWAAVPLAAATLTKLFPGLVLAYLMMRDRRALVIGLAAVGAFLAVGHILYGPLLGFGYPGAILSTAASAADLWSVHPENESLRGLVFKLAAGFRYADDRVAVSAEVFPAARLIAYGLSLLVVLAFAFVVWRRRRDRSEERLAAEFTLAIVVTLLVSPHTAFEYLVLTLPVFAFLFRSWLSGRTQLWAPRWIGLGAIALMLIGVFVPLSLMARFVPVDLLIRITDNEDVTFLGAHFGGYTFFCIPILGVIALWLILMRIVTVKAERPA